MMAASLPTNMAIWWRLLRDMRRTEHETRQLAMELFKLKIKRHEKLLAKHLNDPSMNVRPSSLLLIT